MNIIKILAILLLFMSPGALAGTVSPNKNNFDPCRNYTEAHDFAACYQRIADVREKEMNSMFKKLHENYKIDDPDQALSLEESQRTWVNFKDANCRITTWDSRMGTGFSEYWNRCVISMTESREKELKNWLDNP